VREATLKVVVAWSERRNLCGIVRDALREVVTEGEMLPLGDDATIVHTGEPSAALRDRLREDLADGDHVFVAEFETWSAHGAAIDAVWLLARGH
jgi:hypothetical protein